jgi:hypothetical protein
VTNIVNLVVSFGTQLSLPLTTAGKKQLWLEVWMLANEESIYQ